MFVVRTFFQKRAFSALGPLVSHGTAAGTGSALFKMPHAQEKPSLCQWDKAGKVREGEGNNSGQLTDSE
jgi:hypothetical protein